MHADIFMYLPVIYRTNFTYKPATLFFPLIQLYIILCICTVHFCILMSCNSLLANVVCFTCTTLNKVLSYLFLSYVNRGIFLKKNVLSHTDSKYTIMAPMYPPITVNYQILQNTRYYLNALVIIIWKTRHTVGSRFYLIPEYDIYVKCY